MEGRLHRKVLTKTASIPNRWSPIKRTIESSPPSLSSSAWALSASLSLSLPSSSPTQQQHQIHPNPSYSTMLSRPNTGLHCILFPNNCCFLLFLSLSNLNKISYRLNNIYIYFHCLTPGIWRHKNGWQMDDVSPGGCHDFRKHFGIPVAPLGSCHVLAFYWKAPRQDFFVRGQATALVQTNSQSSCPGLKLN